MTTKEAIRFLARNYKTLQFAKRSPVFQCGNLAKYPEVEAALVEANLIAPLRRNPTLTGARVVAILPYLRPNGQDWKIEYFKSQQVVELWLTVAEKLAKSGGVLKKVGADTIRAVKFGWGLEVK